jgi:uncharacterized protein
VNELFLPTPVVESVADTLLSWTDEHDMFYVASDDYRERRLADVDIRPMKRGFLDGINGALRHRGIDSDLRTAVFISPVHAQVPDVAAAIRLVETFDRVYDLGIDAGPLEEFARTVEQ